MAPKVALASFAIASVASADYVITRNGKQTCTIQGQLYNQLGEQCCTAPKAAPFDQATFCFNDNNARFTLKAGSFGSYTLGMSNDNIEDIPWTPGDGQSMSASWSAPDDFAFNYGGDEKISSQFNGDPMSPRKLCHEGVQCCTAGYDGCCTTGRYEKWNLDPVKICSHGDGDVSLVSVPSNPATKPASYKISMYQVPTTNKYGGVWSTYWKATGGPFREEQITITARNNYHPPSPPPYHPPSPPPAPPADHSDQSLINEFNDPSVGIAFSMISLNCWASPGNCNGINGYDRAGFYSTPPATYHDHHQQCMTVVTRNQAMSPYPAYGSYGVVFHIGRSSEFWKYFEVIGHGHDDLVAGPADGGSHTPGTPDWRKMPLQMGKSYDWFASKKNAILSQFHGHAYNEFVTNGLSPHDLAGVFVNDQGYDGSKVVPDYQLCNFVLDGWQKSSGTVPVFGYKWGSLYVKKHLSCSKSANSTVIV